MAGKVLNSSFVHLSKFGASRQESVLKTATSHIRKPLCTIKKMTITFQIVVFLILTSCQTIDKVDKQEYCSNEIELLKGNSLHNAHFDFNLTSEEQIENLQDQVVISLCRGRIPLNGTFQMNNSQIETLLLTDWYCIDSTNYLDEVQPRCFIIHSKQILINSNHKILADGQLIKLDSLTYFISELSRDFFWHNSFRLVAYELIWDDKTENKGKFQVFKAIVNGYLQAANEISLTEYKTSLCELDSVKLEGLKKEFRFAYLIEKERPPPPLPFDENFEIEIDTIEPELEMKE